MALSDLDLEPPLPVTTVAPKTVVDSPAPQLENAMKVVYQTGCQP